MKLDKFKEKNKMKIGLSIGIASVILLLAGIYLYRTFAIFEEQREFNMIKGQVPSQNYDISFSYYIIDSVGTKRYQKTMPSGKDWMVAVDCNNDAIGTWNYDAWGPLVTNLKKERTQCSVNFREGNFKTLRETLNEVQKVTTGSGLYAVNHNDSSLSDSLTQIEYRYAGVNPNNYLTFNGEKWRIIGIVNTKEGSRIKIVRSESIGSYSWDSSPATINAGLGINEWSKSDIRNLLNEGSYWNRESGICINEKNNKKVNCDFSSTGLSNNAKNMIEEITWNTASQSSEIPNNYTPKEFYDAERGNTTGKICNSGTYCTDEETRTTEWLGRVGLMYPSDYGYSSSTDNEEERTNCLNTSMNAWSNTCITNNWLYKSITEATMTPIANPNGVASDIFYIANNGTISNSSGDGIGAYYPFAIRPTVYLKDDIKVISGDGEESNPFNIIS